MKNILIILAVVVVAGVGYFAFINKSSQVAQQTSTPTPTKTAQATKIPTATPDPTANWKTYTNTQYGFSFKYPQSWTTTETTANGFLDTKVIPTSSLNTDRSDGLSIGIMTGKQFGDNYGEATVIGQLATPIAGKTTYELTKQGEVGGLNLIGYFSFQSGYMTFSRSTGNSIANQILSTFKFTK